MQVQLNFNFKATQERAYVGVRRAAAFLGLSERFIEGEFPRSLTLGRSVKRQLLPDPFPEESIDELRGNWQVWIVGNALRELDQFLSLYLDDLYDLIQQAKIVSGEHPPDYEWKRIDRLTNVAEKHKLILEKCNRFDNEHLDDQKCLISLSLARNCLSHDLGIVTPKRATNGELVICWLSIRTVIEQDGKTFDLDTVELPFQLDSNGSDGTVIISCEIAERRFALGSHLRLTADELLGVCIFYQMVIDRLISAVQDYACEQGVVDGATIAIEVKGKDAKPANPLG